ncbi:unnamed protein product [Rotaria sordida]|uniref:Uncharacterized protein n=1 Tax=Rotaria sordida TaxID=392033 RepID=A0A819PY08_9BILA|nr:unnamed protein product [Rotaria sordida]
MSEVDFMSIKSLWEDLREQNIFFKYGLPDPHPIIGILIMPSSTKEFDKAFIKDSPDYEKNVFKVLGEVLEILDQFSSSPMESNQESSSQQCNAATIIAMKIRAHTLRLSNWNGNIEKLPMIRSSYAELGKLGYTLNNEELPMKTRSRSLSPRKKANTRKNSPIPIIDEHGDKQLSPVSSITKNILESSILVDKIINESITISDKAPSIEHAEE